MKIYAAATRSLSCLWRVKFQRKLHATDTTRIIYPRAKIYKYMYTSVLVTTVYHHEYFSDWLTRYKFSKRVNREFLPQFNLPGLQIDRIFDRNF